LKLKAGQAVEGVCLPHAGSDDDVRMNLALAQIVLHAPIDRVERGARRLQARDSLNPYTGTRWTYEPLADPEEDLKKVYRQCLATLYRAGQANPYANCDEIPIFAPGLDVEEAANHDLDAILQHPTAWAILTSATSLEKEAENESRFWYNKVSPEEVQPSYLSS
jgi:hypothetical protein